MYRYYLQGNYSGQTPTLQDFHAELLKQPEEEAHDLALAIELFTEGSLNTFAKPTNVDTGNRLICYNIRDLGKQLLPVGMLVVLDSIFNRVIRNRQQGKRTWIFIDEIYLLSYITNIPAGRGLLKYGSAIVTFEDSFPKHTKLYGLMTTKVNEVF